MSAGAHVTLAPLGAQVNAVICACMSSVSYSVSRGRFEYTETPGRWVRSAVSVGSSNPRAQGFSRHTFAGDNPWLI